MIDISGIEYDFLPGILWWLVPVLIATTYILWMLITERDDKEPWGFIGGLLTIFGVPWLALGWVFLLVVAPSSHVNQLENTMKIEQLEEQGFANVEITEDKFVASKNGEYFRGALVSDGVNIYRVVELPVD